jgi:predicted metal-dependent enzyme (double-stranded beta helix superfamily)
MAFDRERFVEDCQACLGTGDPQAAVRETLARALADPRDVLGALGEPKEAGFDVLLRSDRLTIFAAKWAPRMSIPPHNHRMWALIGIYAGREDNIFWKRSTHAPGGRGLAAGGARALFEGDIAELPVDAIHSVTNPLSRFAGGLHLYGGDFFATERSQWNAETLAEEPSNGDVVRAMFERENERLRKDAASSS